MKRLIWSGPARDDLFRIARHYAQFDPELPLALLTRIQRAPLVLLDHPKLGEETRRRGVRKWSARGTPFILLYAVQSDAIEIRRVVHAASDWRAA